MKPRNEDFYRAMLELRRSNSTTPRPKRKPKGSRADQRREAIREHS